MATLPYSRLVADLGLSDGHRMMIEAVAAGARVLDVGCAGGYLAAPLTEAGCVVTGVEPDAAAAEIARAHCAKVTVGDFELADTRAQLAGPFDAVIFGVYVPASVAYHHGSATATEASPGKYFLVGRNRMRLLAKNATSGQLMRWGWAMALYDLAYVLFVAATDRTLSPLRGRLAGLGEWRRYRRAGAATRGPAPLAPPTGPLGAWRQRAAYRSSGSPSS